MYGLDDIRRGIADPRALAREANRLIHTRGGRFEHNPRGVDIFEEEWDNLVILDACRYDTFTERRDQFDLPGRLESRYSLGGATYQFVRANFTGQVLHDTVYVSANPWYLKLRDVMDSELHRFVNLQTHSDDVQWVDEELSVVTPGTMTEFALRMNEEYPNKRLIVHYLQPHHPFIGPTGQEYFDYSSSSLIEVIRNADSGATIDDLWEAYIENFDRVVSEVETLLPDLDGRSIVTADHGEMLGDRHDYVPVRDYGHHHGIFNDPTVAVPWLVVDAGSRKRITAEPPEDREVDVDESEIDEHLRNLGYKV